MKLLSLFYLIFFLSSAVISQTDKHSTLFYGNSLSINPASAGMFNGDGRIFSSYRNQWSSVTANPFSTINFSADGKILNKQINNGFAGIGMAYHRDKSGDGGMTSSNFGLALSYAVEVQKEFFLSAGVQAGLGQYKLNYDNFNWGNQWVGNGYDNAVNNFEPFYDDVNSMFDLSAGVFAYGVVNENIDLEGGISVGHILRQDVSFISSGDNLYRNITLSFFPEFRLPYSRIGIDPGIYSFIQGPNKELTLGSSFKYFIKESSHYTGYFDETSISFGTFLRLGDAVLMTSSFNHSGFSLGVSYDVNFSKLKVASSGLGAYEFFLRYRLGFGYKYSTFR